MKSIVYFWITASIVLGSFAEAAEVIAVGKNKKSLAVSHDVDRRWQPTDRACVLQGEIDVVCGEIIKVTAKGAIVKLDTVFEAIAPGDRVRLYGARPSGRAATKTSGPRATAPLLDSVPKDRQAGLHRFNLGVGMSAGLNYFFPMLNLEAAPLKHFSLGLLPLFFKGSADGATVIGFGGYGSVSYYSQGHFRGLWVQAGGGLFSFNASSETTNLDETITSPAFLFTVGYRGYYDGGFNVGFGAGIQYIQEPTFTTATIKVKAANLQPLLMVDLGYSF